MPKTFSGATTYADVTPEAAFARHIDADFLRRKFDALGARDVEVDVARDGDAVTITVDRKVDADVPGFAKKVLSPSNNIHLVERWRPDGDGYVCDWTADSSPAPAKLAGTRALSADGAGTQDRTDGTIDVKVPLIGGKLADWLSGEVNRELTAELDWLESQPA